MTKLSTAHAALLDDVAAKHAPSIADPVSRVGDDSIGDAEREALVDAIAIELLESGLLPDHEPNVRGLELEALLDVVNRPLLDRRPAE